MRKLAAGLLAFVLVFAAAACGDDSGSSSSGTGGSGTTSGGSSSGNFGDCDITVAKGSLGDVKLTSDGELTVATNLPAPGFWNGDDPDSINGGFEYCMAADIATSLGLDKVKVVNVSFDALVAGQTAGFDLALSQVTITDERAKVVDFSTPYFSSDQGVLVNKGTTISNIDEAKKAKWGVQASTTGQSYLADVIKPDERAGGVPGHALDVHRAAGQADRRRAARHLDRPRAGRRRATAPKRWSRSSRPARSTARSTRRGRPTRAALDKIISGYASDGTLQKLPGEVARPGVQGRPVQDPLHHPVATRLTGRGARP